mmetsp:Transcript_20007/g.64985  ORF Transcript_20007/g.64985 Transcript_20007/m.64985 type:complete len:236 (-) Transcript_20007:169-876(-)|eukprot:scaffold155_cov106-Isochrysis_galbana.AAC.11
MHHKVVGKHLEAKAADARRLPQLQDLVTAKAAEALVVQRRQAAGGNHKRLVPFLVNSRIPPVAPQPSCGVGGAVALRKVGAAPAVACKDPRRARRHRRHQRTLAPNSQPRCVALGAATLKGGKHQQPALLEAEPAERRVATVNERVQPGRRQEVYVQRQNQLGAGRLVERGVAERVDRVQPQQAGRVGRAEALLVEERHPHGAHPRGGGDPLHRCAHPPPRSADADRFPARTVKR